ncbi:MAG: hypothetical protein OXG35_19525 [Acidobacteria bacterium]|nr:hypothetical protein [Acidobacteriota bacterium]
MSSTVGCIKAVAIRKVWPTEHADFTPWLQTHIGELDNVLGLGLTNPQREVGAGDFSIDLVAETNFGDVVIENQFGRSDHRHLGQLVTYLSQRDVERAIWITEEARLEHVKAVETLNDRGIGQIWMVTVRAIKIGDSSPAPLFTVVAEPADIEIVDPTTELTQSQVRRRDFLAVLFAQARDEGIDSPFKNLSPRTSGMRRTNARGPGLVYRVAVNRKQSRVVITNVKGKWLGALGALLENRQKIDRDFAAAALPRALEWTEEVTAGRWVIRYQVDVNYQDEPDSAKMLELNRAAAEMKRVFDPYLRELDPQLEEGVSEPSVE